MDLFSRIDVQFRDAYFSQEWEEFSFESESHQERRRDVKELEMVHLVYIASGKWERYWNRDLGNSLKEPSMNAMLFHYFTLQADGAVTAQTYALIYFSSLMTILLLSLQK